MPLLPLHLPLHLPQDLAKSILFQHLERASVHDATRECEEPGIALKILKSSLRNGEPNGTWNGKWKKLRIQLEQWEIHSHDHWINGRKGTAAAEAGKLATRHVSFFLVSVLQASKSELQQRLRRLPTNVWLLWVLVKSCKHRNDGLPKGHIFFRNCSSCALLNCCSCRVLYISGRGASPKRGRIASGEVLSVAKRTTKTKEKHGKAE